MYIRGKPTLCIQWKAAAFEARGGALEAPPGSESGACIQIGRPGILRDPTFSSTKNRNVENRVKNLQARQSEAARVPSRTDMCKSSRIFVWISEEEDWLEKKRSEPSSAPGTAQAPSGRSTMQTPEPVLEGLERSSRRALFDDDEALRCRNPSYGGASTSVPFPATLIGWNGTPAT